MCGILLRYINGKILYIYEFLIGGKIELNRDLYCRELLRYKITRLEIYMLTSVCDAISKSVLSDLNIKSRIVS